MMQAERRQLTTRIDFATIEIRIQEERRAGFNVSTPSLSADLRNAAVDGLRAAVTSTLFLLQLLPRIAPVLVLWATVLVWPLMVFVQRRARAMARRS